MKKTLFLAFAVLLTSIPSVAQDPEKRMAERMTEVQALAVHESAMKLPKVSEAECSDTLRRWSVEEKLDRDWYVHLTVLEVLRLQSFARACNLKKDFTHAQEFDYWIKQFDLMIENALWQVIIENNLVASTNVRPVTQ